MIVALPSSCYAWMVDVDFATVPIRNSFRHEVDLQNSHIRRWCICDVRHWRVSTTGHVSTYVS